MAGRVGDAERLAREAFDLGRRAQARDAETIYTAQMLILRRREDALSDYVATIEKYVSENPALYAWRAILPMAHLMSGNTQAGVAQFRELARDEFAAIPRDMFWFTAIALLGETCALIGDTEQAPVLYRLLEPAQREARADHAGRQPRLDAPLPRSAQQPRWATSRAPRSTSSAALERNTTAGCARSSR